MYANKRMYSEKEIYSNYYRKHTIFITINVNINLLYTCIYLADNRYTHVREGVREDVII